MKRNQFIKFRVTESEKQLIIQNAKLCRVSTAEYLRTMGKNGIFFKYLDKKESILLRKSLNNLNQYLRFMHSVKKEVPEARELISEIKTLLKKNTFKY